MVTVKWYTETCSLQVFEKLLADKKKKNRRYLLHHNNAPVHTAKNNLIVMSNMEEILPAQYSPNLQT